MRAEFVLENIRQELSKPGDNIVRLSVTDAKHLVEKFKSLESAVIQLLNLAYELQGMGQAKAWRDESSRDEVCVASGVA